MACLQECNSRQEAHIYELTDNLTDVNERLCALQDAYVDRGNELVYVKACLADARKSEASLKRCCERLGDAIRQVLYPASITTPTWKTVHKAIRSGIARRGFHPRCQHPFWSFNYWFGCSFCVPEWFLYSAEELTQTQMCLIRDIVLSLEQEIASVLQPALTGKGE